MLIQLLFNPVNREFVAFGAGGQDLIGKSNLLVREVELEDGAFNAARYIWKGTYDTGDLIDLNNGPAIVTESDVDFKNFEIFARKYKMDLYAVEQLCNMDDNELEDFLQYRQKIVNKIKKEKDFFIDSNYHEYISKEDLHSKTKKSFEVNPD